MNMTLHTFFLAALIAASSLSCTPGTNTPAQQGHTGMVGDTSKSGNTNQTVDQNMKVHRDNDGSVTGKPGVSPYEGRTDQSVPAPDHGR
jgi:hypothetical protein